MSDVLAISADLSLSLQAVTETFGILAVKRAGKSNAAVVLAEEMYRAGLPWVAIDPKGDWYGVRAEGTGPGLSVLVFGGQHGDVPLEPTAGRLIADLVVEQRLTCVLDVSEMTKADQRRFLFDFADRLYRTNTAPLHVFCEEADEYIPQMVRGESAKVVGAFETLVKRGGFKGIGITLITQRSASLNKDVLTQVGTLIVLRTTSPQDQKAILGWIQYHAAAADTIAELPGLGAGEAFVYSPAWLDTPLQRITFRRRSTFDSGATPEAGVVRRQPTALAEVDLAAIKEAMAATIEKADAQDPHKLMLRVAELERQLAEADKRSDARVRAVLAEQGTSAREARLKGALSGTMGRLETIARELTDLAAKIAEIDGVVLRPPAAAKEGEPIQPGSSAARSGSLRPANGSRRVPPTPRGREAGRAAGDAPRGPDRSSAGLGRAERAVLAVLIQHGPQTQRQLAVHTGYSVRASTIGAALSKLRKQGLVSEGSNPASATQAGRELLSELPELPTGPALLEYWMGRLGRAERAILSLLLEHWPDPVSTAELAVSAGYSPQASTAGAALSKLRTFGLVEGNRASDDLAREVR
jgi:DNA-binding MarR family transcriptional regulator